MGEIENNRLEVLKEQRKQIVEEIDVIEAENKKEENKLLVGKFYKTRNSYGGEKPEYWTAYQRVDYLGDESWLHVTVFDKDCHGNLKISSDSVGRIYTMWEEINEKEFLVALRDIQLDILDLLLLPNKKA